MNIMIKSLLMRKSIIFAFLILFATFGWLATGQINSTDNNAENNSEYLEPKNLEDSDLNSISTDLMKVESKIFNASKIDQSIILQGQTIYNKKIDVKSEIIGNVVSASFKRGDDIKKGAQLIEISRENRNEMLISVSKLIELYNIEYSSTKKLLEKGLGSKSQLALAAYNLADAKSKLKNIKLDIENTNILAPFDGIITNKNIEVGDYVAPGNILLTIVNLNPIKIQGYLSEFDVSKVQINTKTTIKNSNGIEKIGKISFISPSAETSTRTFEIEIKADNSDLTFKSGTTASITIEGSELLAHKIPPSILTLQDDGSIGVKAVNNVYIVIFYPIKKVKDTIDGMWVSGLPKQVNLIITGQEYVNSGQKIDFK